MSNVDRENHDGGLVSRSARSSFRAISSCLRIVSSGASMVARSAADAASCIVERVNDSDHDQVIWAGFDKLEGVRHNYRRVLLLGYHSGFQVWDVEEANNVHNLVSTHDGGAVSCMHMLPNPIKTRGLEDEFLDSRPLLVLCSNSSSDSENIPNLTDNGHGSFSPTVVRFYSLKCQTYVHMLEFRSVIYSVRCSSRIVAVSQATQIHCFDATSLEKVYTILTNSIPTGSRGVGYGPLAVGPRWLAYSGTPIAVSNSGRVSPQNLAPPASATSLASNGSLVAHYAKESSKQLAAGIATLGGMGYKFSKYCSEILPESYNSLQSGDPDADSIGTVIVRDMVSKNIISQFRAHKNPISALCFDPSGILLATASVKGHNVNIFRISPGLPESSSACDGVTSSTHLFRLQRGLTNAVIQDITFSSDGNWIMVGSSRGTGHLFAIDTSGPFENLHSHDINRPAENRGSTASINNSLRWPPTVSSEVSNQFCTFGPPATLSAVSRIRNENNSWIRTVSGAAAAATGRSNSLSGAIASSFCSSTENNECHVLVFSPSGFMTKYAVLAEACDNSGLDEPSTRSDSAWETEETLKVEAIQKWNICQKCTQRKWEDNFDIYGKDGSSDCSKVSSEESKAGTTANEKPHSYISQMELRTHSTQSPLWQKPQFSFQPMVHEITGMGGGELEIERNPVRKPELIPINFVQVHDNLQTPCHHLPRCTGK